MIKILSDSVLVTCDQTYCHNTVSAKLRGTKLGPQFLEALDWCVVGDWDGLDVKTFCPVHGGAAATSQETVDHPRHYTTGNFEVIDVIEDWKLGFNTGNAVKYIARHEHKGNPIEDLRKARWYIDREIARLENLIPGVRIRSGETLEYESVPQVVPPSALAWVHFKPNASPVTACGVELGHDGAAIRHARSIKNVTCEQCMEALRRVSRWQPDSAKGASDEE